MSKILIIFGLIMMSIGFARVANAQEQQQERKIVKLAEVCEGVYWQKNPNRSLYSQAEFIRVTCYSAAACEGLILNRNSTGSKSTHEKPLDEVTCVLPNQLMFVNAIEGTELLETEFENLL